jgi:prophage regulatory protein
MRKLIKKEEVMKNTSLPHSTLYRYINQGLFPKPVKLGPRSVAWFEDEVEAWIKNLNRQRQPQSKSIQVQ